MGFMRALGRPIFAYTNDARPFFDRVAASCGGAVSVRPTGEHEDPDGMAIEPYGLHDNLMLAGGGIVSGGCIIAETTPHAERYRSLVAFERCVVRAAAELSPGRPPYALPTPRDDLRGAERRADQRRCEEIGGRGPGTR